MPKPAARAAMFSPAWETAYGVVIAYWLFSQMTMMGSFQTAARFRVS